MNFHLFPTSSLFLAIIITFSALIHIPACLCQDNEQYVSCNGSVQCANIPNIRYPFWGGNRPYYCGHPSFELTNCQGDVAIITIQRIRYRVLEIGDSNRALTVAREDLWNTTCPTSFRNTTLDFNIFSYASGDQNITLSYDCTGNLPSPVAFPNQFNCSNRFSYFSPSESPTTNLPGMVTCNQNIIVPVNQSTGATLRGTSASVTALREGLASGFGLQWSVNNDNCTLCSNSGGQCGQNTNSTLFACYCGYQSYPLICGSNSQEPPRGGSTSRRRILIIALVVGLTGMIVLSVIICCLRKSFFSFETVVFWKNKKELNDHKVEAFLRDYGSLAPKRYKYRDIKRMTNSFTDKLGQGGYGFVFKGKLQDGRLVAVKLLCEVKGDGQDFINEVASISRTSHVNVVTLLGFCFEGSKRALIYEFMLNGSLDKFICHEIASTINTHSLLDWKTHYQIALGTARGLAYLHRGCNTRILHLDIKPQNILLDEDLCPKISDFGLSKLCQRKESIISMTGARGTPGYIAPEVFFKSFGGVSHKSDVYSYGMMVLEMAGAREDVEVRVSRTTEVYFPDWIYDHLEPGKDLRLYGVTTEEEEELARKMILVGLWCIQTNPSERPSMSKVVELLEGSLESLQIPPKPQMFSRRASVQDSFASFSYSSEKTFEQKKSIS